MLRDAYALPFKQTVFELMVHILAVVGRYVDERRVELAQFAYGGKQPVGSCAFYWRQHLEREVSLSAAIVNQFGYCHRYIEIHFVAKLLKISGIYVEMLLINVMEFVNFGSSVDIAEVGWMTRILPAEC